MFLLSCSRNQFFRTREFQNVYTRTQQCLSSPCVLFFFLLILLYWQNVELAAETIAKSIQTNPQSIEIGVMTKEIQLTDLTLGDIAGPRRKQILNMISP